MLQAVKLVGVEKLSKRVIIIEMGYGEHMNKISIIPDTIDRGIKSRATNISRFFPIYDKEDLIQDGYVLVLQILKKKPGVHPSYLMSALKRFYSHKKKTAYLETIARVGISDVVKETLSTLSPDLDNLIDRSKVEVRMKTKSDVGSANAYAATILMTKCGMNKREIKTLLGKDTNDALEKVREG